MEKAKNKHGSRNSAILGVIDTIKNDIARLTEKSDRVQTAIPSLSVFRAHETTQLTAIVYEPSICMVAQGAKRVILGEETYVYDPGHFLLTSVDLPTVVQITDASKEKPYLGLKLKLDVREISQLLVDSSLPAPRSQQATRGMATGEVTLPLLTAVQRLIGLLDDPRDIPILAPLLHREICYRLLTSELGIRLRQIASAGSLSHQIGQALQWLRLNFSQPLRIEDLAGQVSMSKSAFHHHFRSLTAMSPLQYQKNLRLSEARRLMLIEHLDATTAALQVGYESPSQFSREYCRMFGAPPLRDISALRRLPPKVDPQAVATMEKKKYSPSIQTQ